MVCPRCGDKLNGQNRLVTDSCGHFKCRHCFLNEVNHCLECTTLAGSSETNAKTDIFPNAKKKGRITAAPKHVQQVVLPDGVLRFHCMICGKRFRSRSQQYYHRGCDNEATKKYKCDQCGRHFSSRSHFNYHNQTHDAKRYPCSICGKTFSNQAVYRKHLKLHQQAPTACTQCGKVYRCKESLAAHLEQHRNNLQFQCTVCEKRYAVKSTLQQHMLKHFAKKHQCPECEKRFQRNSTLKLHLKRHANKSHTFDCPTCYKSFSDDGALLRHTKLHKVAVRYKCVLCDITTVRKDNMLRHVRNMHLGHEFASCVEIQESEQMAVMDDNVGTSKVAIVAIPSTVSSLNDIAALPQTVQNSTVIKCIGNVKPVKIPDILDVSCVPQTLATLESANIPKYSPPAEPKSLKKKKYDPIEMYRRILISDDEEMSTQDPESVMPEMSTQVAVSKPTRSTVNTSNFSEMHWRKNFKYTYEYQEY